MNMTNQQLAFARVQLSAAESAGTGFARRAHWQAAVWQLSLAMEAYAQELQQEHKTKFELHAGPGIFSSLSQAYAASDRHSLELDELVRLEQMPDSWLNQLQSWNQKLLVLGAGGGSTVLAETSLTAVDQPAENRVELIQLDSGVEQDAPLTQERLSWLIDQAAALVERQRENRWEY